MIVDAHVHLFPDRLAEAIRRWFSEHAWDIRYRIPVDEAVRTLREGGIDRCVVLPYAHKPGMAAALHDAFLNLYLDTTMAIAGYFSDQPDLELLRRRANRILYGTDFPNLPYEWDRELGVLRGLGLPAADEALILSGNAVRLFGIQ